MEGEGVECAALTGGVETAAAAEEDVMAAAAAAATAAAELVAQTAAMPLQTCTQSTRCGLSQGLMHDGAWALGG